LGKRKKITRISRSRIDLIMSSTLDFYKENGYIILKNAIPADLISAYEAVWLEAHSNNGEITSITGWENSDSFQEHNEILDIMCHENVYNFLNLINDKLTLHLSFTTWTSTRKSWHQDSVSPDKEAASNYVGVWVALDNISVDSGPFQFVPGSHKWDLDFDYIYDPEHNGRASQALNDKILEKKSSVFAFTAEKGDILIWDGHLVHGAGSPKPDNFLRKSLIGHYDIRNDSSAEYGAGRYFSDPNTGKNLFNN
jgi:ectoine hydroxylase-related dioxygenase (phytanoyl-CoA dioxygenase family)